MGIDEKLLPIFSSEKYDNRLNNDKILDELEAERLDIDTEIQVFSTIASRVHLINGTLPVSAITPGSWHFLWLLKNNFVLGGEISATDVDIFLFIHFTGLQGMSLNKNYVESLSKNFCLKKNIPLPVAVLAIRAMIKIAHYPLEMLPRTGGGTNQVFYDADWLLNLGAVAAAKSGETTRTCIFEMSLAECYFYQVQQCRDKSKKRDEIRRRTSDEVNAEIYQRAIQIAEEIYQEESKNE